MSVSALSRRRILSTTAMVPVVVALAACNGLTAAQLSSQVATDVGLVASGLAGALPGLGNAAGVSSMVVAKVGQYIADIQTVAGSIVSSASNVAAQPKVQQLEGLLNSIVASLAGLNLPSPFGPALTAATILLPIIESTVGLVVTAIHPAPAASAMAPDAARLVLRGAAMGR